MRLRERAEQTLASAKWCRRQLVERLAKKMVDHAGSTTLNLNSTEHWADVGRYNVLNEILFEEDKK